MTTRGFIDSFQEDYIRPSTSLNPTSVHFPSANRLSSFLSRQSCRTTFIFICSPKPNDATNFIYTLRPPFSPFTTPSSPGEAKSQLDVNPHQQQSLLRVSPDLGQQPEYNIHRHTVVQILKSHCKKIALNCTNLLSLLSVRLATFELFDLFVVHMHIGCLHRSFEAKIKV